MVMLPGGGHRPDPGSPCAPTVRGDHGGGERSADGRCGRQRRRRPPAEAHLRTTTVTAARADGAGGRRGTEVALGTLRFVDFGGGTPRPVHGPGSTWDGCRWVATHLVTGFIASPVPSRTRAARTDETDRASPTAGYAVGRRDGDAPRPPPRRARLAVEPGVRGHLDRRRLGPRPARRRRQRRRRRRADDLVGGPAAEAPDPGEPAQWWSTRPITAGRPTSTTVDVARHTGGLLTGRRLLLARGHGGGRPGGHPHLRRGARATRRGARTLQHHVHPDAGAR